MQRHLKLYRLPDAAKTEGLRKLKMAVVPSLAQGALLMLIATLACITSGSGSIFPTPMVLPPPTASPKTCPLYSTKGGFHLEKVYC